MEVITNIWTALVALTLLVFVVTYFWIVVQAFKEHLLWGLAVFIVPIVYVAFSVLNWKYSKRPFLIGLVAGMALVLELIIARLFQTFAG